MEKVIMTSSEKIDKLLKKLNFQDTVIPDYLKQLLLFTGYDNIISICRINEESINKMEIFAREKLPLLLTAEQKQDFFGIYVTKEQHFEISFGHKVLLNVLVEKSRKFLECTDPEKTQEKTLECSGVSQYQSTPNIKRKYSSKDKDKNTKRNKNNFDDASTINVPRNEPSSLSEDDKSKAVNHIKKIILNYVIKFLQNIDYDETKKSKILSNLNNICVEIKNQTAYINCTECNFISKTFTQIENGKYKWILSNFNKHFKTHFKNKKPQNIIQNSSILKFVEINPRLNIIEKNINEHPDDCMANNNVIIIPYDNVLDTTKNNVCTEAEELSNLPLCPLSNVDNLFQKEIIFIENMSESSTSTCTQLHTDDQLISHNTNLFLDLSSDFSEGGLQSEITEETIQSDNNSDKIVQLSHEIKNFPSRLDRTKTKRNLVLDMNQKKITDFFEICERIEQHINDCEIISEEFISNLRLLDEESSTFTLIETNNPLSFLEMLKNAAVQNSNTKSQCNRFSDELKKLSLYIFLTAGRLAYETLVANMDNSLPSIATLYRTLKEFPKTVEGDLKCSELKTFLQSRNYPMKIFISEDQTAIIKRIRYNSISNQMVGFVCQTSKTSGFPVQNQYQINSVKDIQHAFQNGVIAQNAYVFMAQPLVNGAPAFCLAIFGSNNKFSAEDVLTRWNYLKDELKNYGISVMGFSSDGDPRCLKAMKLKANLPNMSQDTLYAPYFKTLFSTEDSIMVQNTIHIATKIKTRLLKDNVMPVGEYFVSKEHLKELIEKYPKTSHFLTSYHLDENDKMNFDAINKMCDPKVLELLNNIDNANATKQLLLITRYVLDSYIDKSISIELRVYYIWYATFFLRLWRAWLKKQDSFTLSKNWLTLNTYTCIELNAHAILLILELCRKDNCPELFLPWLFSSQPCEKFFRQTRAMSSTYSTVTNFDMLDLLNRNARIQCLNNISADSGNHFRFPREDNVKMGKNSSETKIPCYIPKIEEIKAQLNKAKYQALVDAIKLKINLDDPNHVMENVDLSANLIQTSANENLNDAIDNCKNFNDDSPHEIEIHPEDSRDIENDLNMLTGVTESEIKDYTFAKESNNKFKDKSFLKVQIKNKVLLVRKSTLCWFFATKCGRLSTDRLLRVRGMSGEILSKTEKDLNKSSANKQKKKIQNNKSMSSIVERECEDIDEENEENEINSKNIETEKYYAVYYDKTFYIGRVIEVFENSAKIKFLKSELDIYKWPKETDIQVVQNEYLFFGPVTLIGTEPFYLNRHEKILIEKKYKELKRIYNN